MTMLIDEYRAYTDNKMKQILGTPHVTHGVDLEKLRGFAQDNTKWAYLVNHITNMMRVSWVRTNCTRKQQEVPWSSSTPIIRLRPADARIPRRAALPRDIPRLLCWPSTRHHHQRIYNIYKYTNFPTRHQIWKGGPRSCIDATSDRS